MHLFSASKLVGSDRRASRPCRFIPGERDSIAHWIEGWLDPTAGLDYAEKEKLFTLPGLELRSVGRLARGQSLYRLRYCGSTNNVESSTEFLQ
jgi:hypothetical protein